MDSKGHGWIAKDHWMDKNGQGWIAKDRGAIAMDSPGLQRTGMGSNGQGWIALNRDG